MSNQNYSLEVISHHPTFKNKSLRKYYVDGIDTIGAWGDEPFEIKFTNHTWQKVQVKISLDGTDILTGEKASTEPTSDMWVVNGYGTMSLKAWPETNNGGASFVFTSANNSVAVHTHGDLSSRGIIAAAVYVEGHVEPIRLNPPVTIKEEHHHHHHHDHYPYYPTYPVWPNNQPIWLYNNTITTGGTLGGGGRGMSSGVSYSASNNAMPAAAGGDFIGGVFNCSADLGSATLDFSECGEGAASADLSSLASVGAGQHVDQKITYVAGLIKPVFTETVRIRYMWWDELVTKLRQNNVPAPHPSGFPADRKKNINLGNTPRIGDFQKAAFPREQQPSAPVYLRV